MFRRFLAGHEAACAAAKPTGRETRRSRRSRPGLEQREQREVLSQLLTVGGTTYELAIDGDANQVLEEIGSSWTPITATSTSVSEIAGGGSLFMLGNNGSADQVWKYAGSGTNWTPVTGTKAKVNEIAGFGTSLYMLGNNGGGYQVWVYDGSGASWTAVTGTNTTVTQIGVSSAELFMLGANGGANQLWEYLGSGTSWTNLITDPASDLAYDPAPNGVQLFNSGGPSYLDVEQGAIEDCWLLASLAEVADRDPLVIQNMFVSDGTTVVNGSTVELYSVQLFSNTGIAFDVEVDTELPYAGDYFDHLENDMGTQALWVALAEKAYAEANTLGLVTVTTGGGGQDSYDCMNNGDPTWALHAITGKTATDSSLNPTTIASDWDAGCLIVLCTPNSPVSSDIVGNHCYAVVGYNASSSQPFEIFNPWGTNSLGWAAPPGIVGTKYGRAWVSGSFISQNFDQQSIGTGTADGNSIGLTLDGLIELATLSNHSDVSVMDRRSPSSRSRNSFGG